MEELETIWRFAVTGLAVWRLSRLLLEENDSEDSTVPRATAEETAGVRFWASRAVDLACWISVWMSSQTAIWVTCGLTGVIVSWLAACGFSRLLLREMETPCLRCGEEMRVRNG